MRASVPATAISPTSIDTSTDIMAATSERDEVFWSYERGYREAQELFDEDKLIEAMEKADELVRLSAHHHFSC
jgi:hypothetical protein